jgi:hypothetical protein
MKLSQLFLTFALLITAAFTFPVVKNRSIAVGDIARLDIGTLFFSISKFSFLLVLITVQTVAEPDATMVEYALE